MRIEEERGERGERKRGEIGEMINLDFTSLHWATSIMYFMPSFW